jgi:hypothetical protein
MDRVGPADEVTINEVASGEMSPSPEAGREPLYPLKNTGALR